MPLNVFHPCTSTLHFLNPDFSRILRSTEYIFVYTWLQLVIGEIISRD